jgi:hypothetical protein
MAAIYLTGEVRTKVRTNDWVSVSLAGKQHGGLPMSNVGAKESQWIKTIALSG